MLDVHFDDIPKAEKVMGLPAYTMADILGWWILSLENPVKKSRVLLLKHLTIILEMYRKDYILKYSDEIWVTLDHLLTQVVGTVISSKTQFQNIEPKTPPMSADDLETGHPQFTS
ncbi:hypothetical protein DFS33DRAFT_1277185 [Desarmillaria ectypa]|nr:hypothetical protein DFS33DRAFT_1277185 [Desarmillaria ectypa]